MTKPATIACAGCGHDHRVPDPSDPFDRATYRSIQIAPDVEVAVCGGGKAMNGAKIGCVIKACRKASLCPGCGDELSDWPIKTLCENCGKKIDLAERVQKQEETRRRRIEITQYEVLEPPYGQEETRAVGAILDLLVDVTGSEKTGSTSGTVWAEVTEKQAEAIGAFVEDLKMLYRSARNAGHAEGRNVLFGLASGKLTVDELERHEVEKARRTRGSN